MNVRALLKIGHVSIHPKRVFFGWWIVVAGFTMQFLNGGLLFNGFGAYFVLLQAEFGWNKTVLSGAFALTRAESGVLGPLEGWLIDKMGPRAMVRVGLLIFGGGFMLLSLVNSVTTFYLVFVLMALGSSLGGFMAMSTAVAHWFVKRRATAMGIAMTGMGVGGLLVPGLAWFLNHYGWRAGAFWSGVIILAVGLPMAQLLRHKPEQYGYLPDGAPSQPAQAVGKLGEAARPGGRVGSSGETGFTVRQALRESSFWLISAGHSAALLVVGAVMVHLIPHAVEKVGLSLETAAMCVSVLTAMDITGRLLGGFLGDRISKRLGIVGCMIGHASALALLAFATNIGMVLGFAVVHGLAWGVRGPLLMSLRADYFGRRAYATIYGFSSIITMVGMTLGPIVAGYMADRLGDYRIGFLILAGLAAVGSVMFLMARKPKLPVRAATAGTLSGSIS